MSKVILERGWLKKALDAAETRANEMPYWMRREERPTPAVPNGDHK